MINTDTFLKIGDSHKICQDYIIQGNTPTPFLILSDGCSSSNNTEMGAGILCHLAKQYLKYRQSNLHNLDYYKMGSWIIHNAELTARQLGLPISCLDATLIISFELDGIINVFMYGDGAIICKNNSGIIEFNSVEFDKNAPYYLTYYIDEDRDKIYHINKNSKIFKTQMSETVSISKEYAYDAQITRRYQMSEYQSLLICSDGIQSFIKKTPTEKDMISIFEVLSSIMAFKTIKGEFLKRRLKKALNQFTKDDIVHYDDLSVGAYMRID